MFEPEQKIDSSELDLDHPHSFVEILKGWSCQCFETFTQPGVNTLAQEGQNASGRRISFLLMLYLLFHVTHLWLTKQFSAAPLYGLSFLRSPYSNLVIVFCNFFVSMGILYLVARLLRGRGTFFAQCYLLLFPLVLMGLRSCIVSSIDALVGHPSLLVVVLQSVVTFVLWGYITGLSIRAVMAVHRFSWRKAAIVLFLAFLMFFLQALLPGNPFQF